MLLRGLCWGLPIVVILGLAGAWWASARRGTIELDRANRELATGQFEAARTLARRRPRRA
ncbi:hypothetical protein [Tautonia marina]|uniref:hypothetical protein n=1 Tax=Tautonia marina TaxID=2653855 RepID=UPI0012610D30|nr:hypothetical protein [Tautonia marina]